MCLLGGILTDNGVKERALGVGLSDENFTQCLSPLVQKFQCHL